MGRFFSTNCRKNEALCEAPWQPGHFFLLVLVAFILAQAQRARWKDRELVGKRMAQRKLGRTSFAIAGKIPVPTAVKIRMRARVHAFLILHWPFPERIKREDRLHRFCDYSPPACDFVSLLCLGGVVCVGWDVPHLL